MKSNRIAKFLFVFFLLTACSAFSANAQISAKVEEQEVPILKESYSRNFGCFPAENAVVTREIFEKIISAKECSQTVQELNVDFEKETLINYRVSGDCFVHASAKVFRRDDEKKYTVRIRKTWGGCRAAGSFQGWFTIEKIPPGYNVEFSETRVGYAEWNEKDVTRFVPRSETLETRALDLKGCIQTIYDKQFVIKDEATYLKTIRHDASRDWCLKNLEKIDFRKHTLLGIEINSGYCEVPLGLEYQTVKDTEKKQYLLSISYLDPRGSVCRALSQYDLWLLVPKLPEDYEVKFEVKAKP